MISEMAPACLEFRLDWQCFTSGFILTRKVQGQTCLLQLFHFISEIEQDVEGCHTFSSRLHSDDTRPDADYIRGVDITGVQYRGLLAS